MVNILSDGATYFYYSEDLAQRELKMERTGKWDDSVAMLERLVPPIEPIA